MKAPLDDKLNEYIMKKKDKPFLINIFLNMFDKMAPETVFFAGEYDRLPLFFYYLGGFFWNAGWIALFTYFLYASYKNATTSSFVSLQSDSGVCTEVPFSVTGRYRLDNYGSWESQSSFKGAYSMMSANFKSFSASTQNYSKLITTIGNKFKDISKKSMYRDLAYNLNVLASAYTINTTMGRLEIQPTGDIGYMLNKQESIIYAIYDPSDLIIDYVNITYENFGCFGNLGTQIELATNTLTSEFTYSAASAHCQLMADYLGYNAKYGDTFKYKLDLASFSTAVAVNNFILSVKDLQSIGRFAYNYGPAGSHENIFDDATNYDDDGAILVRKRSRRKLSTANQNRQEKMEKLRNTNQDDLFAELELKFNRIINDINPQVSKLSKQQHIITGVKFLLASKYVGMDPLFCLIFNLNEDQAICFMFKIFVKDGTGENIYTLMYPVTKHYLGTNCSDDTVWGSQWYDRIPETLQHSNTWIGTYDHTIDILLGILVFPDVLNAIAFAYNTYDILTSSPDGDLIISNVTYYAMKHSIDTGLGFTAEFPYPSKRELCGVNIFNSSSPSIDCFLIAINQYGSDYYINADHYQLFAGACRNSIYHEDAFTEAAKTPPTELIQTYYSCLPTTYDAVFNSVGLSLGNAEVYMIIGWCIFSLFLSIFLWSFYGFDPKMNVYPQTEEDHLKEIDAKVEESILLSAPTTPQYSIIKPFANKVHPHDIECLQ